jgi:hypothetical protein
MDEINIFRILVFGNMYGGPNVRIAATRFGLLVKFPSTSKKMVGFPGSYIKLCMQNFMAVKDKNTEMV